MIEEGIIMDGAKDRYTIKFLRFYGTRDDDFLLWCLRLKAALKKLDQQGIEDRKCQYESHG